jgi:hypothetical protein
MKKWFVICLMAGAFLMPGCCEDPKTEIKVIEKEKLERRK